MAYFLIRKKVLEDTSESNIIFINFPETTTKSAFVVVVNKVGKIYKIKPVAISVVSPHFTSIHFFLLLPQEVG